MKDENQNQSAGDNSFNIQGKNVVVHRGMSMEQLDEVKEYIDKKMTEQFRANFISLHGQAQADAEDRARNLLEDFIERLSKEAPENITSINTVSMQNAIYNAQKTAAITGDSDLADTLVDILIDKSGAEAQSFKGVVLGQALEVAAKLTTEQINALSAVVMISQTVNFKRTTPEKVVDDLAELCTPLYHKIPTNKSAFQYMSYTGVGTSLYGGSFYNKLATTYDGAFSKGFTKIQVPEPLHQFLGLDILPVLSEGAEPVYKPGIATSQSLELQLNMQHPVSNFLEDYKGLLELNKQSDDVVENFVRAQNSNLADFLDKLAILGANSFSLSTVGIAIGQANWRRVHPSTAPEIDIYLD